MKKILITGDFEGAAVLIYGPEEMNGRPFKSIDLGDVVLDDKWKALLLSRVPQRYTGTFAKDWGTDRLRFTTQDYTVDFDIDFWDIYGKKRNRDRSITEWGKMTLNDRALAVFRLPAYLRYLARTGIAKADPENYLRKKYYKDDWDNL